MRTWGIICTILTGLLAALQICAIYSCGDTYLINDQGQLTIEVKRSQGSPETKKEYNVCDWHKAFPEFPHASERMLPGDTVYYGKVSSHLPVLGELEYKELYINRDGRTVEVHRKGHIAFFGALVGVSAIPLLMWAIVAAFLKSNARPPPAPETG